MLGLLLSLLPGVPTADGLAQPAKDELRALIPRGPEVSGVAMVDSTREFSGLELYQLIDGGADLFFEYGFRRVVVQEYAGHGSFKLEIYEMTDTGAAYGIYSVRSGEQAAPVNMGMEGCKTEYYIMFWKGRYYVSIESREPGKDAARTIEAIARAVDRNIRERGERPSLVGLLGGEHPSKLIYFRGMLGLGTVYYLDANIAPQATEGVAEKCRDHLAIQIKYLDSNKAWEGFVRIDSVFKSLPRYHDYKAGARQSAVTNDARQSLCLATKGSLLVVVIAGRREVAEENCKRLIELGR